MKTNHFLMFLLAGTLLACNPSNKSQTTVQNEENTTEMDNETQPEPTSDASEDTADMVYVVMETNKGDITLELDPQHAPATVDNFLTYVDSGFYDGTIFHRVIPNFMIQGGGFVPDGTRKDTRPPIVLESQNGLSNTTGTIAMARTQAPNSATSQFFINVNDNLPLDYRPGNPGYAVFGRVTSGMDVVNEIRQVETGTFDRHADWPTEPVIIERVYREDVSK